MKVAIDIRPLQIGHESRGIGTYLLNLLDRLPADEDISYIFVRYDLSDPIKDFSVKVPGKYEEVVLKKYGFSRKLPELYRYVTSTLRPQFGDLSRFRPNVLLQCDYLLGAPRIWRCKVIVVAYDLIPYIMRPELMPPWNKYLRFGQYRFRTRVRMMLRAKFYETGFRHGAKLLKRANRVVGISENTANDLVKILGMKRKSIDVIYPAASFRQNDTDSQIRPEIKKLVDGISNPFISYVGGTDPRRKLDDLLFGFHLYNSRIGKLDLFLCGSDFSPESKRITEKLKKAIANSSYKQNLHPIGHVTEAEKKYILTKSAAFVFPSLYEGFGIPLLEAMECRTPIITYKNSSIPEVAGDVPIYTEETGGYSIFLALIKQLNDAPLSQKTLEKGAERAKKFDWETGAKQVWDIVLGRS